MKLSRLDGLNDRKNWMPNLQNSYWYMICLEMLKNHIGTKKDMNMLLSERDIHRDTNMLVNLFLKNLIKKHWLKKKEFVQFVNINNSRSTSKSKNLIHQCSKEFLSNLDLENKNQKEGKFLHWHRIWERKIKAKWLHFKHC